MNVEKIFEKILALSILQKLKDSNKLRGYEKNNMM